MAQQHASFTTAGLPHGLRAARWTEVIASSYFPLDLAFRNEAGFRGALKTWALGDVLASRLRSDALAYRRRRDHLRDVGEEEFLVTIPRDGPVSFTQMGREVTCPPGGFIVERGNEPYEFSYAAANDLIAVKIAMRTLAGRMPDPGRYCAMEFDGRRGVGALMIDLIRATEARHADMPATAQEVVGRQAVDLLSLAVEGDPRAAGSRESSVRAAHIARINRAIERDLAEPDLGPARIAAACGISTRYLHDLCSGDGPSVRERVREARLQAARRILTRPGTGCSITEIAFSCGFADASSFARVYRARFGVSPRAARAEAIAVAGPVD